MPIEPDAPADEWTPDPRLPMLVFDFDGTVSLGDGPVLAYADAVAEALAAVAPTSGPEPVPEVRDRLRAAARGEAGDPSALDGYDRVARLARTEGGGEHLLSRAYRRSRERLGTAAYPSTVPDGLADFLAEIDGAATRVLATNSPPIRIAEMLDAFGLATGFDRVIPDFGKPAGLATLLGRLPTGLRVLTVGDVWRNDLAPAAARGHATALVGGEPVPTGADPTFRATSVAGLYPQLRAWIGGPPRC